MQATKIPFMYSVTHHVVSNLPLTPKLRLRFSKWASYYNGTFVLMSTEGLKQRDVSPCRESIVNHMSWLNTRSVTVAKPIPHKKPL